MKNKWINIYFILIIFLAVIAGVFVFSSQTNNLIDSVNSKYSWSIPHVTDKGYNLGLDLQGGVHLEYEADLSQVAEEDKEDAMNGLRDVIERRVNIYGVTEPLVQIYGKDRLVVELPGDLSIEDAISYIGDAPLLQFLEEKPEEEIEAMQAKYEEVKDLETFEEIQAVEDWELAFTSVYNETELTGQYLKEANLIFDNTTNQPIIELVFDDEGAKLFEELTENNVGKTIAIYLDGQPIIGDYYAPVVNEKITGGKAVITSTDSTLSEIKTIVQRLNQGALPVPLSDPIVQQKIGPTLGQISLDNAIKAGIVGLLAIIIFLIVFYRLSGFLGSLALVVYTLIVFAIIKLTGATLTLAGIGGIILSIGMAVDANILIFSRMKEEIKDGRGTFDSIEEGLRRAWTSIRDGNFTTLIVAFVLYFLGTSFVKAFAFTLIIGILVSLFSAMVVTRIFLLFFARGFLANKKWLWI
jgi:protein-export membrane protein SecD